MGLALSVSLIVLLLLCGGALAGLNTFEVGLPVHDHAVRIGPPDLSGGRLGARLHTRKRSRGRSLCKEAPCGPPRRGLKKSVLKLTLYPYRVHSTGRHLPAAQEVGAVFREDGRAQGERADRARGQALSGCRNTGLL